MPLGTRAGSSDHILESLEFASVMGLDAVQIRTRSTTHWFSAPLKPDVVRRFRQKASPYSRANLLSLASPLINLATPDETIRKRSTDALYDELMRAEALGVGWVVIQPGVHDGQGEEWGCRCLIKSLNEVLLKTREWKVGVLLQSSAGEENSLCHHFDQMAHVRRRVQFAKRVQVCLDIKNIFAAGYDIRDRAVYESTIQQLERLVGIRHVKAIHMCDSLYGLGSFKSASAHIGEGEIGMLGFDLIMNDSRLASIPMILSTGRNSGEGIDLDLERLTSLDKSHALAS